MSLSVDWTNKFITIPKSDLTLISGSRYKITVAYYWQLLREANAGEEGILFDTMYNSTAATSSTPQIVDLINGYTAEFEDGLYSVELVNGNTNFREIEVKNQVSVGTNNTTGFIDPTFLENGLFVDGAVHIDTVNGVSGTDKTPAGGIIGTRQTPSNNIADSKQICINRGLNIINFVTDYTIVDEDLSVGYSLTGDSPFLTLTVNPLADVTNCSIELITITGEMDGLNRIEKCRVLDITEVSGMIHKIALAGNVTISGPVLVMESYSNWVGEGHVDFVVGSHSLEIRDFHGSFGVSGMTGGVHSIGLTEGRLIIDADCTGGTIYLRGTPYEVVDNSNGVVTVINQTLSQKVDDIHGQIQRSVFVDTELVTNGNGYQQTPYNNWTDGVDYAEVNGLKGLTLLADATVDRQLKNFTIKGIGVPIIDLNNQIMDGTVIERCQITGSYSGSISVTESAIVNLQNMRGVFLTVSAAGTLTVAANQSVLISRVAPAVAALAWTLDMNSGNASTAAVHNSSGEVVIDNMDNAGDVLHFHATNGRITINPSCVIGTIDISGNVKVIDNSGTGCTVNITDIGSEILLDAIA